MRRNNLSVILPEQRRNSTLSLNLNNRPSTHIVQSAENRSFIESIIDDQFENNCLSKRRKSSAQCAKIVVIEYSSSEHRSNGQLIRAGSCLTPILDNLNEKLNSCKGETLIHLSSRLGHEHILRRLIQETSYATRLTNAKGQTPLLCAIQSSYSSIGIFLMEIDPVTITVHDKYRNSVFHYAANLSDDIVLSRAIYLIKRLNNPHQRIQALSRLIEKNVDGKTAFILSIEKGSIRCNRLLLSNKNVLNISLFLNSQSIRCVIDNNRIDIILYWLSDLNRFEIILNIYIINSLNALEYSIEKEKIDFIKLFISQDLSKENIFIRKKYLNFLNHFNEIDCLTPIQRLLNRNDFIYLVPFILDQFIIQNYGADLAIIDDSLFNSPKRNRCLFGHKEKSWSTDNWINQHPLTMIAKISNKSIDDHSLVRLCVDLKYQLFGNVLYFAIAFGQIVYVTLYTSVVLASPTPSIQSTNYYSLINNSCNEICFQLSNYKENSLGSDNSILRIFRTFLLILSCLTLFKEGFQLLTQKNKYFKKLFINLLEIHMYISGIVYGCDLNECTRRTGLRCHIQWEIGAIGLISVWTSLLLVLMQGIKFGKHGLLFITVLLSFLKLITYYIFIWIGYYLALYILLKDIFPEFTSFYFIPKLLVMFIGEFDLDSTFFPDNKIMKGSEGALIVFSAFIFTMFIVMSNILGGLAVADVKEFRLNAKREHLHARIETILNLQRKFGFICEICSKIILKFFKKCYFNKYLFKYDLSKLEIKTNNQLNISISNQTGLLKIKYSNKNEKSFINENFFFIKNQNQLKEYFEDSIFKTNCQLRRIAFQLRTDIQDLKQHFDQIFKN